MLSADLQVNLRFGNDIHGVTGSKRGVQSNQPSSKSPVFINRTNRFLLIFSLPAARGISQ